MSSPYACNVIIDLEFTAIPRKRKVDGLANEIIEIGAVRVLPDGSVGDTFSRMVKPTISGGVSVITRRLTGIGSEDVLFAKPLAEVLDDFVAWIGQGKVRMVTWSPVDERQLKSECLAKHIAWRLPDRWLDIQRMYPRLMGTEKRLFALGEAADWCGISNDRCSAHRALYDAQMTAELFRTMSSGECAAQRRVLDAEVKSDAGSFSASIADQCGGLASLLASLRELESA